jgi:hypothetical protein
MTFKFDAEGRNSEAEYWKRQFPAAALEQLAKNGLECTDKTGFPFEDSDPIPVMKLFMADGPGEWLLGHTYPNDPDLVYCLANLGYGAELGDVRISDLKAIRGAMGLPLERDICFEGEKFISKYRLEDAA